jgi:ribosomal protein L33
MLKCAKCKNYKYQDHYNEKNGMLSKCCRICLNKAYLDRIKKRKTVDKVELNRFMDHQLRFKEINKELKIYFFIMRERKEYLLNKKEPKCCWWF